MATEELNKPPSLPPYPQMILEALDSLKQPEGANKSSISKFMESKYGEMPAGHADLLSHHLARMHDSGDLLFLKNNYLRPGSDGPPVKRGRGRPPKPKDPLPDGATPPPRPRGRPRKDPNSLASAPAPKKPKLAPAAPPSVSKTGRPRGRPRKVTAVVQPLQNGVEA